MTEIDEDLLITQINEQVILIEPDINAELEGVYNIRKQYEIYFKYTAKIIDALPDESVAFITESLKKYDKIEVNRILVEPIHAFLLDRLLDTLMSLIEFDSDNYESITHQLQCEAANLPWYDPVEEIWMNRLSIDEEFTIKAQFTSAGKLNDYLDGEFKLDEVQGKPE